MKKFTLFAIILFLTTATLAQDLPLIAVYVTGEFPENEKKVLGTMMLASLVNSGRYRGIERTNAFLTQVEEEHQRQRSGAIDDSQISELGKQFGVKFVCVADITPAFNVFHVSTRIINVETAEVAFIGESSSPLKTMEELTQVSNEVVKNMFGGQVKAKTAPVSETQPKLRISQEKEREKVEKEKKYDGYFAARYMIPVTSGTGALSIDLEGGWIWGKGTFLGIETGLSLYDNLYDGNKHGDFGSTVGLGVNYGRVHDFTKVESQVAYGVFAGVWRVVEDTRNDPSQTLEETIGILGPFIRLRWKMIELSYRWIVGSRSRSDELITSGVVSKEGGLGLINQLMIGFHFESSKRQR